MGDFNMVPSSFAHTLVLSHALVSDTWLSLYPHTPHLPLPSSTPEYNITVNGLTCDSMLNTWTSRKHTASAQAPDPYAKRLDYIFHSLSTTTVTSVNICFTETIPPLNCSASDLVGIH